MQVNNGWVTPAEGCKIRVKPDGSWKSGMSLGNMTLNDLEEKTLVEIEQEQSAAEQEAQAAAKKAAREEKYMELIREHYSEIEEQHIRDSYSDVNLKLSFGEKLTDEDQVDLDNWSDYRNVCRECDRQACNFVYGDDCSI